VQATGCQFYLQCHFAAMHGTSMDLQNRKRAGLYIGWGVGKGMSPLHEKELARKNERDPWNEYTPTTQ